MHIKQVLISGFRSFRSQNEIESFSPKHNVIVGRNGSGKSNFFDAIQFVLVGPRFATLRQEDRQHLLHEGAGSSVMAAYVEIIFDNTDGRFPVDTEEVVLRRTVGHKKDEFFLNRKRIQKSEVLSLLESAGFSKSNPYYIVQQGKVANLCIMRDNDRLNLLKEVAGTTVYEERRAESLKIMQETANKQEKVKEVLSFIEDRLKELEKEKKELSEYESLDKQRRALEYTLYDKERAHAAEQLAAVETQREQEREEQQTTMAKLAALQDQVGVSEDALASLRTALDRLTARRDAKSTEFTSAQTQKSTILVEIQEARAAAEAKATEFSTLNAQLREVSGQIADCVQLLEEEIEPVFTEKTDLFHAKQQELAQIRARVETLYGKQGRRAQFSTKAERNKFLQGQIDSIAGILFQKQAQLQQEIEEIAQQEVDLAKEQAAVDAAEKEQKGIKRRVSELTASIQQTISARNNLQEKRKIEWRELEKTQESVHEARTELDKARNLLNRCLPKSIAQGLVAVEQIVAEQGIRGYYGPLIDNFSLKAPALRTAVEVAAGNALFHVIVDTDTTAAHLIKELDTRNAGRLTFLPLNRLHVPRNVKYPDSTDVRPLLDVALEFDPMFDLAMRQVFGQKLLARDLETASHFSRESQLDAVTRDGDVVNRKGGFEGGFHDDRTSKILAVTKIREFSSKMTELAARETEIKANSERNDTEISGLLRELQRLENERDHLASSAQALARELTAKSRLVGVLGQSTLEARRSGARDLQDSIAQLETQIQAYKEEQASPLTETSKTAAAARAELRELESRQDVLVEQVTDLEAQVRDITLQKQSKKADLDNNLNKRKAELELRALALGQPSAGVLSQSQPPSQKSQPTLPTAVDGAVAVQVLEETLRGLEATLSSLSTEIRELETSITAKNREINDVERDLEEKRAEETELDTQAAELTKQHDKLINKRTLLLETLQTKQRLIRELGSIPRIEMTEFQRFGEKLLMKRLKEVNEGLKKYASVNKKALDQCVSFNEQREALLLRKQEMDKDSGAIEELVRSLDAQKDETILRTFEGVAQHFAGVFSELVPGGQGRLKMLSTADQQGEEGDETQESESGENPKSAKTSPNSPGNSLISGGKAVAVSAFRGVQIHVSFSGSGQQYEMQQLSGGQKALVALALIFSIQRCDPAPFYLFDEIDQALDANYRAGVAQLIQKQVESATAPAQFITTTFRPELVAVADRCFGIALSAKVSNIYPLDKEDAQVFVTDLMQETEAVGNVSAVPSYSRQARQERYEGEKEGVEEKREGERVGTDRTASTRRQRGREAFEESKTPYSATGSARHSSSSSSISREFGLASTQSSAERTANSSKTSSPGGEIPQADAAEDHFGAGVGSKVRRLHREDDVTSVPLGAVLNEDQIGADDNLGEETNSNNNNSDDDTSGGEGGYVEVAEEDREAFEQLGLSSDNPRQDE